MYNSKMYLHKILLALFIINCVKNTFGEDEKPQYKIVFDKMTKEKETVTIVENNLTFDEGASVSISGELKQLVDLNDDWKVSVSILRANAANEDYSPLVEFAPKGICEMMKTKYKAYFYESVKKNVPNAPEPEECPLLKRTYKLQNYELDTSKYKKFLKPGYYRVIGTLIKDDEELIKYVFDAHVEEDK